MCSDYLEQPSRSFEECLAALQADPVRWISYSAETRLRLKGEAKRREDARVKVLEEILDILKGDIA